MQGNFKRVYRLRIEPKGATKGFEIGAYTNESAPLHISFSCERSESPVLNTSQITIWNLSKEHRDALAVMGTKVYLSAGYGETVHQIFAGTVVQSDTERDGGDRKTTLQCVDGYEAFYNKVVSVSFDRNITCLELVNYIGKKIIGEPVITVGAQEKLSRMTAQSYSYFGKGAGMLDEVCGAAGVEWHVDNGILTVKMPNEGTKNYGYVIKADTGLIGYPKRIFESSVGIDENNESTNSYSLIGWEVDYLMNGAVNVGDIVKIVSKEQDLNGTYYVYRLSISGDNYGGDWKCTAQCRQTGTPKAEIALTGTGG